MVLITFHPVATCCRNDTHAGGREIRFLKILDIGLTHPDGDGFAARNDVHHIAPCALVIHSTVCAYLDSVFCGGRETFNGERIAVGFNEVFLIAVETDLPSGGRSVFSPAECGRIDSSASRLQFGGLETAGSLVNGDVIHKNSTIGMSGGCTELQNHRFTRIICQ